MPLPVGHALSGMLLAAGAEAGRTPAPAVLAAAALAGNLPDVDFVPGLLGLGGGYHQGATHSLGFALAAGLAFALLFRRRLPFLRAFALFSGAVFLHVLLDALARDTAPPVGVPLWWPFSDARVHAAFSVFPGVKKASLQELLMAANLRELAVELLLFLPPAWFLFARRRPRRARAGAAGRTGI